MSDLKIPIAAITDEFSPILALALPLMKEVGMTAAELRVVNGTNLMDLAADELKRTKELLDTAEMPVISLATPILKCVLPNAPDLDTRFQQDVFASAHRFDDQQRLIDKALGLAHYFGAPIIRVFSYWRTLQPERCREPIAKALNSLADLGKRENVIFGLENEHACNVGTAHEAATLLDDVRHPNLGLVWDPANALVAGENPFPDGYRLIPKNRVAHVHAKDCHLAGHTPVWGPLGTRHVDWKGQIAALLADDYKGYISLETHWPGPNGDKLEASRICGWNLRGLVMA